MLSIHLRLGLPSGLYFTGDTLRFRYTVQTVNAM
jgi:hypothetical protein